MVWTDKHIKDECASKTFILNTGPTNQDPPKFLKGPEIKISEMYMGGETGESTEDYFVTTQSGRMDRVSGPSKISGSISPSQNNGVVWVK